MEQTNENTQQDRRRILARLTSFMVQLKREGMRVSMTQGYGTATPSTFIIVENTKIENGKIKEAQ